MGRNIPHSVRFAATSPPLSWGRGKGPSLVASSSSPPSIGGEVAAKRTEWGSTSYAIALPTSGKAPPATKAAGGEAEPDQPPLRISSVKRLSNRVRTSEEPYLAKS